MKTHLPNLHSLSLFEITKLSVHYFYIVSLTSWVEGGREGRGEGQGEGGEGREGKGGREGGGEGEGEGGEGREGERERNF